MITLAEGVETQEQAHILLCLGCELGQGWHYGRPDPAERIREIVAASQQSLSPRMLPEGSDLTSTFEALPAQRMEMVPELFPRLQPFLHRAVKGEAIKGVEAVKPSPVRGKLGKTVVFSYQPAFDEAHEVIGISVAVIDITERDCQ
jgi:hypothetical protein